MALGVPGPQHEGPAPAGGVVVVDPEAAHSLSSRRRQDVETHPAKMRVGGERRAELQLLHHDETRAIGKGIIFVAMPKEDPAGFLRAHHANPLPT